MAENTPSNSPPEGGIDYRQLGALLLKHKKVIALCTLLGTTLGAIYTARLPKRYQATASAIIAPRPDNYLGREVQEVVQVGSGNFWSNEEYYNTQLEVLKSRELAKMTVRAYGLHHNRKFSPEPPPSSTEDEQIGIASSLLLKHLAIKPPKNNRIVRITFVEPDPHLAKLLANAHLETFIQYHINLRTNGTDLASKWLSDELDIAERDLRESERKLYKFKKEHDILSVSLEDRQSLIANTIQRFTEELNRAKTRRIEIQSLVRRVEATRSLDILESPIFDLVGTTTANSLKSQYYTEAQKLAKDIQILGPKHDDYKQQQSTVAGLLAALKQEARSGAKALQARFRAAQDNESALGLEVENQKLKALELVGPLSIEHNVLARQLQNNQEKYKIVLNRLRASDLSSRLKTVNIRLLDKALVPKNPAFPKMLINLAIALALSLLLGISIAFILEFFDRTLRSIEHVKTSVGAPVLGVIPKLNIKEALTNQTRDLYIHQNPTSKIAECCRSIRTNLLFMSTTHPLQSLVVTSPNPYEGKTTSALYLGTTMAQSGQRVLVVETDMRRPRLGNSLNLDSSRGLSNIILGELQLEEAIQRTPVPNLEVLLCGPTPPNPSEILMSERFNKLLRKIEQKYDRILLDSPPLLAVTDAVVLAKRSDGVILLAKAGSTQRDEAAKAAKSLRTVEARIVGAVLNNIQADQQSYQYYGSAQAENQKDQAA